MCFGNVYIIDSLIKCQGKALLNRNSGDLKDYNLVGFRLKTLWKKYPEEYFSHNDISDYLSNMINFLCMISPPMVMPMEYTPLVKPVKSNSRL